MRLKNTTTIHDETLREIIRFTCPSGVSCYDVRLNNARGYPFKGRAYTRGSGYHDRANPFITLYIGDASLFPRKPQERAGDGYLPVPWLADRIEALVYVTAHELRHLWQAKGIKRGRVWGSRGRMSERDACAYGIRMLRAWRKTQRPDLAGKR